MWCGGSRFRREPRSGGLGVIPRVVSFSDDGTPCASGAFKREYWGTGSNEWHLNVGLTPRQPVYPELLWVRIQDADSLWTVATKLSTG